jgi:uncharacterized protein DUF6236
MFGSALYYPSVDIEDGDWLRSAVLFWDDIRTIVPSRIEKPYRNKDTEICEKEGYLRPLRPDMHTSTVSQLGDKVRQLISRPEWRERLQVFPESKTELSSSEQVRQSVINKLHLSGLYPEKMSPQLQGLIISLGFAQLHKGKLDKSIQELIDPFRYSNYPASHLERERGVLKNIVGALEEEKEMFSGDGEWLLVDCDFAELYMAALASMLAREVNLSPLTNNPSAMGTSIESFVSEVASPTESDAKGAIVSLVIEGLKIAPKTPIEKIIAFRRSRETQIAELAGAFGDLSSKIEKCSDAKELNQKASQVYENKIRPGLERLKTELKNQSIQSAWEGFSRSATVSVGAGTALAVFSGLSATCLLGAGAFLTLADVAVKTHFAKQKVRTSSPYTYLLDVERKFRPPKAD